MGTDQQLIEFGTQLVKHSLHRLIQRFVPKDMASTEGMETYAARLASFDIAHPGGKKRTSNAKGAKTLKWPHKTPSVAQVRSFTVS